MRVRKTKSAGGVVLNTKGKVLVVDQKGTSWSLPKGHIEDGEKKLEAAIFLIGGWREKSLLSETRDNKNFVVLTSFSKMHGISGLRAGFASGNKTLLNEVENYSPTYPVCTLSLYILKQVIDRDHFFNNLREKIRSNKKEVIKILSKNRKIKVIDTDGNVVFMKSKKGDDLHKLFLSKGLTVLDLGKQNGSYENSVRITIHSSSKKHKILVSRLRSMFL